MKFKKNAVATHLLLGVMLTNSAIAGIQGVRKPSTGTSSGGSTAGPSDSVVIKPGKIVEDRKTELKPGVASNSCNRDQDSAKFFPLDFFQHISRDGSSLKFELRPDNKVLVKIPASLDVCGKFTPLIHQDNESKNITVMMKLDNDKTYSEYIKCLEDSKLLVDGKIEHDNIPGKSYSEYSYVMDYSFDKKTDIKKTVKLAYGYPEAFDGKDGYGNPFGFEEKVELPKSLCMKAEKVDAQPVYVNKGQDVLIEEINAICKTRDAQKIAEARKSIGNAEALSDIADKIKAELDASYLSAVKADVERIGKEMAKIEDKLNKEKDTIDESTAKKEIAKYAVLAKELDTKFLNPAIYRLDTLMQDRSKTEDAGQIKAIDDEIKKLNEDIKASFSGRNAASTSTVYSLMEKYSITDSAKTIDDIRHKSYVFSKVYAGPVDKRGAQLTFEKANQEQFNRSQSFDRTLTDWTDQYLVGQGNNFPIKKTEKERQGAIDRMNSRWAAYEKKEATDYQKYCGLGMMGSVNNPIKCKEFMGGVAQRRNNELKRRDKDLSYIKGKNSKLEKMGMNWNEYQRKVASKEAAEAEFYDPAGASYSGHEDNFSDRFPGYYGPTTSTMYDPSMYQMGGQMPQMPMMMPGAQMPIQQGQYQMPQPQMMGGQQMGWPGI